MPFRNVEYTLNRNSSRDILWDKKRILEPSLAHDTPSPIMRSDAAGSSATDTMAMRLSGANRPIDSSRDSLARGFTLENRNALRL